MDKDGQVKLGRTTCDRCSRPASRVVGKLVLCEEHAAQAAVKQASDATTLKSAAVEFVDHHR